jgi:hypothetical protein
MKVHLGSLVAPSLFGLGVASAVASACASSSSGFAEPKNDTPSLAPPGSLGDGGREDGSTDKILDRDPTTCAEAIEYRSYVGCDYWPTVTANPVKAVFDYAVIVSNVGAAPAQVTVTGPGGVNKVVTVAPKTLEKIYLPWVDALKGPSNTALEVPAMTASVMARKSAYHLVSSVPVIVYQFNALEYTAKGGPPGKDWSSCGASRQDCFSYSNDASLLLPSTAWTGNYRITGVKGYSYDAPIVGGPKLGGYIVITAASDGTQVDVRLPSKGQVLAGAEIPAGAGASVMKLSLNAGDVAELITPKGADFDLSGGLVAANKPVQVISGIQSGGIPSNQLYLDHLEEAVQPAETLGKQYIVSAPERPKGGLGAHLVRLYGNREGTTLMYPAGKPSGCPDSLGAGDVKECGPVEKDFVVEGTYEFGISTFMVGATFYDVSGDDKRGDPSQTVFASTEQFRKEYVFLAPTDYTQNFAAIAGPLNAAPVLDGKTLGSASVTLGVLGVWRVALSNTGDGAHRLTSTLPVGLQVFGYGDHTSYQYPGGLNALRIAPVPPPIIK